MIAARTLQNRSLALLVVTLACDAEPPPAPRAAAVAPPSPVKIAAPPAAPTPAPWVAFTSTTWGFRAEFPEPPISEVVKVPVPGGELDLHMFAVDRGTWAYILTVLDPPQGKPIAPGLLLDGARNGAVANVSGRLIREEDLTREGLPARRLEITAGEADTQQRIEVLLILREQRLYQAIIAAPAGEALEPEADRFFAALHVGQ